MLNKYIKIQSKSGSLRMTQKLNSKEKYFVFLMVLYISIFLISWTPYAIVSFMTAFTSFEVSPFASTIPAVFAKTSILFSSLFYLCTDDRIQNQLKELFMKKPRNSYSDTVSKGDLFLLLINIVFE